MVLIQLTGLSGAGKTTLAEGLRVWLADRGIALEVIDGDVYRKTPGWNLGFSAEDRKEQIRRLGVIAHGFLQAGVPVVISAINPYNESRQMLRDAYQAKTVWAHCALPVLLERDPKGLYRRALLPVHHPDYLARLTGVNDPYEEPADADLVLRTDAEDPQVSIEKLGRYFLSVWNGHSLTPSGKGNF